jgi:hypothetical protein
MAVGQVIPFFNGEHLMNAERRTPNAERRTLAECAVDRTRSSIGRDLHFTYFTIGLFVALDSKQASGVRYGGSDASVLLSQDRFG